MASSHSHLSDSIHVIHRDLCTKRLNLSIILAENKLMTSHQKATLQRLQQPTTKVKGDLGFLVFLEVYSLERKLFSEFNYVTTIYIYLSFPPVPQRVSIPYILK